MQPPEVFPGWSRMVPPWEEDGDYFLRATGYFTPTIDSDIEEEEVLPPMSAAYPPSCAPMDSAIKENKQPLPDAIIQRIAANREAALKRQQAAALKRKQASDADMAVFTPRCLEKKHLSDQAEELELDLKKEKEKLPARSIRDTAQNCNCIRCAGLHAKPIVAKCVLCDTTVIYSICALHYPNTLAFHEEVQTRSRGIFCFLCKTAMDA